MEFIDNFVNKYEADFPPRPENEDELYVNWKDYNYPPGFELIFYDSKIVSEKKQSFETVC